MSRLTPLPPRRRLSPQARRAQLLDCALGAFAEYGLGRANHARVAAAAGVSVPTVFHYFPSRKALVDAVLGCIEDFFVGLAEAIHGQSGTAAELLARHGLAFLEAAEERPAYIRVWLDWSTAIREDYWPRYLAFQERLVDIVAGSIERGRQRGDVAERIVPEVTARLFVGNAHMAAVMKFAPDVGIDLERHVRRAVDTLLAARPTP
jgi:TetR/AcrR family hemagglutinin/protease transcriptional regulator